ncbi:hypothetical protein MKX03_034453, partial [Papaver bracteatum]
DAIEANIIGPVLHLLRNVEFETKKEAAMVFWFVLSFTNYMVFVKEKCLSPTAPVSSSDEVNFTYAISVLDNLHIYNKSYGGSPLWGYLSWYFYKNIFFTV